MFRRFMVLGIGVLALIGVLAAPGQVHAQRGRGGSARGVNPAMQARVNRGFNPAMMQPRVNPNARRTFIPGFGFTPGFGFAPGFGFTPNFGFTPFGFTPGFNRGFFEPRFNRVLSDRFEDRFEARFDRRFGAGSFDRLENRFGPLQSVFVPGAGFVPGFRSSPGVVFVPGVGFVPGF